MNEESDPRAGDGVGERDLQVRGLLDGVGQKASPDKAATAGTCPGCSGKVLANEQFCHACGLGLRGEPSGEDGGPRARHVEAPGTSEPPGTRWCPGCLRSVADPAEQFCRYCGQPLTEPRAEATRAPEPPALRMPVYVEALPPDLFEASAPVAQPVAAPGDSSQPPVTHGGDVRPPRRSRRWIWLVLAGLALACAGGGGAYAAIMLMRRHDHPVAVHAATQKTPLPPSFADLVGQVKSGVVAVDSTVCGGEDLGTGFIVGPHLVATVEHVVDQSTGIMIKQNGHVLASGTVIGDDAGRDVALIRTDQSLQGHVFSLANRTPALGDTVAALGFPLGLPLTVTRGTISGTGRTIPIDGTDRSGLVQTDAAVNPGNSGGPLLSAGNGDVVGLVDLGTTQANGIGFAVSATTATPLISAWQASPQPVPAAACDGTSGGSSGSDSGSTAGSPGATVPPSDSTPTDTAPLDAVNSYWSDIDSGDFHSAYSYLVPGFGGGENRWVSGEEQAGIQSASFNGEVSGLSGSNATVKVDSLQTVDNQSGCQMWSGDYSTVKQNDSWLIERANITPSPC